MIDFLNETLARGTVGYQALVIIQGVVGIGAIVFSLGLLVRVAIDSFTGPPGPLMIAINRVRFRISIHDTIDELLRDGKITPQQAQNLKAEADQVFSAHP